jgi:hypothetical protein
MSREEFFSGCVFFGWLGRLVGWSQKIDFFPVFSTFLVDSVGWSVGWSVGLVGLNFKTCVGLILPSICFAVVLEAETTRRTASIRALFILLWLSTLQRVVSIRYTVIL